MPSLPLYECVSFVLVYCAVFIILEVYFYGVLMLVRIPHFINHIHRDVWVTWLAAPKGAQWLGRSGKASLGPIVGREPR